MTDMDSRVALALEVTNLRILLTDLLGEPGRNGRWKCPFHQDEHPDLSVKGQKFHCFACHEHGNAFDILRKVHGWNFMESLKWMESRAGLKPGIIGPAVKAEMVRRRDEKLAAKVRKAEKLHDLGLRLRKEEMAKGIEEAKRLMPSPVAAGYLARAYSAWQHVDSLWDRIVGEN